MGAVGDGQSVRSVRWSGVESTWRIGYSAVGRDDDDQPFFRVVLFLEEMEKGVGRLVDPGVASCFHNATHFVDNVRLVRVRPAILNHFVQSLPVWQSTSPSNFWKISCHCQASEYNYLIIDISGTHLGMEWCWKNTMKLFICRYWTLT